MTVNDSSSSVASPAESRGLDLVKSGLLPPLPAAFLAGRDLDLLEPLRFASPRLADPLEGLPKPTIDRSELARALGVANASYGHPAAKRQAERLADPETRVVVTGQQPGLLGGPLYTLTKAVAAALWVRRIRAAGEPAIAVFWVATEDHDYREVSRLSFPGAQGLERLDLGADPSPLLPVGMRTLGPAVVSVLDALRGVPGDRFAEWVERVAGWYRPEARFGEAFCKMMAALLGEECPLLLDAMLPAVKEAERPWLERLTAGRERLEESYSARDRSIEQRGYRLQVTPQAGASPLFILHGEARRRIEWRGAARVGLRGEEGFEEDVDWLEKVLSENPAAVSPGVLARPAIQDAILGTSVQVMGPGEVSYLPQVAPLYELLEIEAPRVALRPQALVLARHQIDKLDALPIELAELLSAGFDLDRALARGQGRELVAPVGAAVEKLLAELKLQALALDKSLEGPWKKTSGQIEKALAVFTTKVNQAATRRDELSRRRAEDLRAACRPGGTLQERVLSTAYFPGKYGERFVEALFEQLGTDGGRLQVVTP